MSHPVINHLQQIHHERIYRVFDDWLTLALAAYCGDEEAYMATMKRYGPREDGKDHPADHFAHALGALQLAMMKSDKAGEVRDHLGEIYEQLSVQSKEMGQYFTPMEICRLMAEMTIGDDIPEDARIADPACGSGRHLIASSRKRPNATFYGTDLDHTCAMMTTLNMLYRNLNSYVVHGDSLRLVAHVGWMTRGTALGGVVKPIPQAQAQVVLEAALKAARNVPEGASTPPRQGPEAPQAPSDDQTPQAFEANKKGQFDLGF